LGRGLLEALSLGRTSAWRVRYRRSGATEENPTRPGYRFSRSFQWLIDYLPRRRQELGRQADVLNLLGAEAEASAVR
jgi:hypothetical protein